VPKVALKKGPSPRVILPLPPVEQRLHLPPGAIWRNHFTTSTVTTRDRVSVSNPATAALLANAFVPEGSEDKVIIEAYPGMYVLFLCAVGLRECSKAHGIVEGVEMLTG
jgi:hypothetical protein